MARLMMQTAAELMDRKVLPSTYDRMALDAASAIARFADEKDGLPAAREASQLLTKFVSYHNGNSSALQKANRVRLRLEAEWPELSPEPRQSPVSVRELYRAWRPGSPPSMLTYPTARGGDAYALTLSRADNRTLIQLMRLSLDGEPERPLGTVIVQKPFRDQYQFYKQYVPAVYVTDDFYFVAIQDLGVFRFSLEHVSLQQLVDAEALPSGTIQSLAVGAKHLYLGIEDGEIVRAPFPDGGQSMIEEFDPLASTSRSQIDSPLDHRPAFDVPHLLFDASRDRLLILIRNRREHGGKLELWQQPPQGNLSLVHALAAPQLRHVSARLRGNELTLSDTWIARWNLATGKHDIHANYALGSLQPTRRIWIPFTNEPTICSGWVWWIQHDGTLGSYAFPNGQPQYHRVPEFLAGKPLDSSDESYLAPIDDTRFLAYYAQRLWLVTPTKAPLPE